MKLIHKSIDYKHKSGKITLVPENDEDMWVTYNLIEIGDQIRASTMRKVQNESSTGSVNVKSIRTNLTIEVEAIDYDSQGCQICIKGRNVEENEVVKMGAYHSLSIIPNQKYSLFKFEWDSVALELVDQCVDVTNQADLAAVIMQEGLAYVCLITNSATLVRAKIELNIPQKRKGVPTHHDKAIEKFIDQIAQAIERHVKFDVVKCVILASPGFLREKLFDHIKKLAINDDKKIFQDNKHKFLLVHSSTGHKHSLREVLADPIVQSKTANTKAAGEVKLLDDFYKMLKNDPSRAFYGVKHVVYAHASQAIETLLISDSLFRSKNHIERRKFVSLVESVKENQGVVRIFSSCHVTGEQLDNLTGIAAILRFPMLDPESDGEDDEDSDMEDNELVVNQNTLSRNGTKADAN